MSNNVSLQQFYNALQAIPGVTDVLGLHIWNIAKERSGLTAHMSVHNPLIGDVVAERARDIAIKEGIRYTSFQIDAQPCRTIWQTIRGQTQD